MQAKPLRILVTGSNKGIGYGIIETALDHAKDTPVHMIMSTRDIGRGKDAVAKLQAKHPACHVDLIQLDVTDAGSVEAALTEIAKSGPVDVLINNAGIFVFDGDHNTKLQDTINTNYHATKRLTEEFIKRDLIAEGGKIIFVSSQLGKFGKLAENQPDAFAQLSKYKVDLTQDQLAHWVSQFETDCIKEGSCKTWETNAMGPYSQSKLFLSIYAYLIGKSEKVKAKNIQVYTCCPGFCATDLNGHNPNAPKDYYQGADTPYWLATLRSDIDSELQGNFFSDRKLTLLD